MKKGRKRMFCIALAIALIAALSISAAAAEESFTITGAGNVAVSVPAATVFDSTTHIGTISMGNDILFNESNDGICITDETGTNSGWKFSIAVTDFYSQGIDDPTDNGTEDMDLFIAAGDWLSFTIDNSVDGITSDGTHALVPGAGGDGGNVSEANVLYLGAPLPAGTPNCSVSAADTINLVTVNPGYGAGKYFFDLNYTICIDEWMPVGSKIDSSASAGGRFDDMTVASGDKVQVFAGTYATDITYSASCNPAS